MRKAIIDFFSEPGRKTYILNGFTVDDIIAWLEKQYAHANFRNKIQIGDKVTRNRDGVLVNLSQLNRVAKIDEKQGEQKPVPDWMPKFLDELRSKKNYFDWEEHKDIEGGILAIINWMNPNYFNEKDGEQKPDDKVEPKFHEGDMIIHKELGGDYIHNPHKIIQVDILDKKYRLEGGLVAHFGEQDDYELVEQKPAVWSEEDRIHYNKCLQYLESISPRKEDVDWLKSLKDRVQPQPKQEWSDGDEAHLHSLITHLEQWIESNPDTTGADIQGENVAWLKSLKLKLKD